MSSGDNQRKKRRIELIPAMPDPFSDELSETGRRRRNTRSDPAPRGQIEPETEEAFALEVTAANNSTATRPTPQPKGSTPEVSELQQTAAVGPMALMKAKKKKKKMPVKKTVFNMPSSEDMADLVDNSQIESDNKLDMLADALTTIVDAAINKRNPTPPKDERQLLLEALVAFGAIPTVTEVQMRTILDGPISSPLIFKEPSAWVLLFLRRKMADIEDDDGVPGNLTIAFERCVRRQWAPQTKKQGDAEFVTRLCDRLVESFVTIARQCFGLPARVTPMEKARRLAPDLRRALELCRSMEGKRIELQVSRDASSAFFAREKLLHGAPVSFSKTLSGIRVSGGKQQQALGPANREEVESD